MYLGFGHTFLTYGPKLIEPLGEARSNHDVVCALARRLGAEHAGFSMSPNELLDDGLRRGGLPPLSEVAAEGWLDRALPFERAHFLDGFPQSDRRFHFKPLWDEIGPYHASMPPVADFSSCFERENSEHPFKLVCPPARNFLNTTFTETGTSNAKEGGPSVRIHPRAAADLGIAAGDKVRLGNTRGSVLLKAALGGGQHVRTLVVEGIWPGAAFEEGNCINTLIGADPVPPNGGVAFHDTAVWVRRA
jgi:anaerobic selenocysteine-containing dehydrogenase